MSKENEKPQNQLNIELPEEVAGGIYSNLSVITHSPTEFILDFIQLMPGVPKGKVRLRIIVSPENAKKLMRALNENVGKYESVHGPIKEHGPMGHVIPMNFGGPINEA